MPKNHYITLFSNALSRITRKLKFALLSGSLWSKRLIFFTGAFTVGIISSSFAIGADHAHMFFMALVAHSAYWPLIVTPLVYIISAYAVERFFPGTPGSGIPQAIAGRAMHNPKAQHYLLGPHTIIGKIGLTLFALLGGASVGREGPTVQIGAAVMLLFHSWGGGLVSRSAAILAGAAAGIAAAFNTPLAGIVFVIEEMARAFEHRNSSRILVAVVVAAVASWFVLGNYTYFGRTDVPISIIRDYLPIIVVGIICGLLGGLFARFLIDIGRLLRQLHNRKGMMKSLLLVAGFIGLITAIIGIALDGTTYGTGYGIAKALLHGETTVPWWYAPAKWFVTAISGVSGIAGGIFSPSLSIGTAFGYNMADWFPHTPAQGVILLGMTAYLAGVTQAPMTSFIVVLEVTGNSIGAVPLIATSIIASGVGRIICPTSLYHALAKGFVLKTRSMK